MTPRGDVAMFTGRERQLQAHKQKEREKDDFKDAPSSVKGWRRSGS